MSEQPDDNPELKLGTTTLMINLIVVVVLSAVLSWVFVPSVRVLGYQAILVVGPAWARRESAACLGGYKESAVSPLVIALKDNDSSVRTSAAIALGKIGWNASPAVAEKAVPALIQALKDKDGEVRVNAVEALGKIGPKAEKAIPNIIRVMLHPKGSEPSSVRESAAEALGEIGPKAVKAVPALIEALKDKDKWVCVNAATALKKIQKK